MQHALKASSFSIYFFRLPRQREVLPREEVVHMLKISVSIKVTAGAWPFS